MIVEYINANFWPLMVMLVALAGALGIISACRRKPLVSRDLPDEVVIEEEGLEERRKAVAYRPHGADIPGLTGPSGFELTPEEYRRYLRYRMGAGPELEGRRVDILDGLMGADRKAEGPEPEQIDLAKACAYEIHTSAPPCQPFEVDHRGPAGRSND